jgi:3-oxoacyl-[acyl-carrier protein] reductase
LNGVIIVENTSTRKVVLLAGGTPDLSQVCARHLLSAGATVAYIGNASAQERAALREALMAQDAERFIDLSNNTRSDGDMQVALEQLFARFGTVSAVVNLYVPDKDTNGDTIRAHLTGLEADIVTASQFMAEKQTRGIVICQYLESGVYGDSPLAYTAAAAKGAVIGLVRTACVRFGKAGVRIVGILAGLLDLPGVKAQASERILAAKTPLGRWITADDVAATVNFLAIDSGYITGQVLLVDGGLLSGVNGV